MEILSPGGIPDGLTLEEIKDGMTAVRNPQLVHILDKMNYIENYGTGIDRMFDAYSGTGTNPEFKVTPNMFKVIFPNLNYVSGSKDISRREINETDILNLLKVSESLSKSQIQKALNLSDYKARKLLQQLMKENKIRRIGKSIRTRYSIDV